MGEKIDIAALPLLLPPFVRIRLLLKLLIKTQGGGPPLLQCWRNINIERWWWSSCHLKPLTTNLAPLGEGQVLYLPIEVVESQPTREHCEQIISVICILTNGGLSNAASDWIGTHHIRCCVSRGENKHWPVNRGWKLVLHNLFALFM